MTTLVMGLPGGMEWVILLVVALLLFGGQRIAGMGKGAGRAIREFKEEINAPTAIDATTPTEATVTSTPVVAAQPVDAAGASTPVDVPKTAQAARTSEPVDAEIVSSEPSRES